MKGAENLGQNQTRCERPAELQEAKLLAARGAAQNADPDVYPGNHLLLRVLIHAHAGRVHRLHQLPVQ